MFFRIENIESVSMYLSNQNVDILVLPTYGGAPWAVSLGRENADQHTSTEAAGGTYLDTDDTVSCIPYTSFP